MDSILIRGGKPLLGQVEIQGSKNAVLPMIAAAVLFDGVVTLTECPDISDIHEMLAIYKYFGGSVTWKNDKVILDSTQVLHNEENGSIPAVPRKYATRLRASILFMGAVLSKCGNVKVIKPGGCTIGERPIDLHLFAMEQLGYGYTNEEDEYIIIKKSLPGESVLKFPYKSVGATENAILAAVLGDAVTVLMNAAIEPEVVALCEFLNKAGAKIEGVGCECLKITGVKKLENIAYSVPKDRIVAGTYMLAAMATGGVAELFHPPVKHMKAILMVTERMGATLVEGSESLTVIAPKRIAPVHYLETAVYPGFPTDLQSQLLTCLTQADGQSIVRETIFENRYKVAEDLKRMGADIVIKEDAAYITGKTPLLGHNVTAGELRGGAALVIAGLVAEGVTIIHNTSYIQRGYEDIIRDMKALGADIM